MKDKEYLDLALNTESNDFEAIIERLCNPKIIRLLHAGMGLTTEAGEFVDALKKHIFYGADLDAINLAEETGDSLWYIAVAVDALETTFKDIKEKNIAKLKSRFPDSFKKVDALNRDLETERKILESDER